MKLNQPVTQQEYRSDDNATFMSTTDMQSHITCANAAFIEASQRGTGSLRCHPHHRVSVRRCLGNTYGRA